MKFDKEVIQFIKSYDFLRLGQAVSRHQWQSAAMTIRRMEQQAKKPGLEQFARPFAGIRQAVMRKDEREAKQILAGVVARRVKLLEQIKQQEQEEAKLLERWTIRHASMGDLKEVAEVEAACFLPAEAASEESFSSRLGVFADCFWLLELDGKIISMVNGMASDEEVLRDEMYAHASLHNPEGKWLLIFGVATLPEYQKKGYAEHVLKRVIEDTRRQGREGLILTCKEHMLHYYAKFGFVNEGDSESEHGNAKWYQMRLRF